MHGDDEYVFRLCFVDCAETSMSYPDRVQDQADVWGISTKEAVRLGHDATKFTMKLFDKNDFVVYTKFKDARGNSKLGRNFAMIKIGDSFLSELLVENGLARVYGYTLKTPDGISRDSYRSRLNSLEKKAKRNGLGGWRYSKNDVSQKSKYAKDIPVSEGVDADSETLTLTGSVAFYSDDNSASFRGTLKAGSVVYILDKSDKYMIKVRATFRGNVASGQCQRADLARLMKK
jgi:endonuclease YncB( thermonuclease family)